MQSVAETRRLLRSSEPDKCVDIGIFYFIDVPLALAEIAFRELRQRTYLLIRIDWSMENTHSQNSASTTELPDRETRRSQAAIVCLLKRVFGSKTTAIWLLGFTAILCLLGC
jgi:hypothetical protein